MICLSFDTDHMTNEWLETFLSTYDIPGEATFFLWKPFLGVDFKYHEVEPHPTVHNLENFKVDYLDFVEALKINANGVRIHSCVFSHMVGIYLNDLNIKYASMATHLFETGLTPYRHPWGIWELPIYYMDNMDMCMKTNWPTLNHQPFDKKILERAIQDPEHLYVFDFHPLHVAINTTSYESYQEVKHKIIIEKQSPFKNAMQGYGAREFFLDLLDLMEKNNQKSVSLNRALELFSTQERIKEVV